MRNDERLRTIYEVMAPYIVRSERNWRDYLAFASRFHKQSFDNILLVYAQDEDVTILATKKQWAGVGRNLISRPKGIAVCVYSNARLTLDYLFDISQTMGKEIHPTNWQLSDEMQKALGERLTFSHGFQTQPFPDLLYALAREAVNDNYEHYLQGLRQETKNHLFEEIPAGGFEAQYIQLLSDSVSYFIGKKCHLPDEAIRMGDGMATVNHFNTVPLVAHLGMAVTSISKAVLLEMERNIRIINRERKVQHEQAEHQSALQRTGGDASPRPANLQQQRGRQAPMQNGDRMYDPYMDFLIDTEAGTLRAFSYENSGIGVYQEADPADPAQEKKITGFGQFFATWLNNIASQGYEPVRATMLVNDEEVDVELRPAPEAAPAAEAEEPEQLSLLAPPPERSPEDLLIERVLQKGPLTEGKKEQIYHFALTHPTGSAFVTFLKQLYGYEGFSSEELGVKYSLFNGDGITIEWEDTQGGPHETKLSWPQAAGIVQRLVDEGRYLEAPAASEPEQKDETQPFSAEYRLLDRLCADCEYFLGEGQRAEKHLWAGSVEAQIAKMRELYAQLPEKPDWLSPETIDAYARRMAAPEQPEETRILDEALGAHSGQIDRLMQAVRGELTVGTLRYSIFEERPHISMIEVLEDYRRQGIATQMLRYLQGQYPDEEIEWGYLTEDGSALYRAVVDEQPNPEYQKVKTDLEDITRLYDGYVQRMEGGGILSPAEAADMDDLEDIQYRLEKELDELRPVRAFVRMEGVPPTQPEERTVTEPPANPRPEPFIPRNFRFSTDYDLYPGGAKTKYKNNILAIKTLKQIEAEQRTATPEEQITLARYVGWGGLANAFSDKAAGWESEYQELKALLTEEEYKAAMRSTITAYYTEPELIRYMYRALERFGFEGGPDRRILDPGMGTGNFYSVLPEQYQGSKLYGVELDSITGRIAKQLYCGGQKEERRPDSENHRRFQIGVHVLYVRRSSGA